MIYWLAWLLSWWHRRRAFQCELDAYVSGQDHDCRWWRARSGKCQICGRSFPDPWRPGPAYTGR